jgi:hypothetical protein
MKSYVIFSLLFVIAGCASHPGNPPVCGGLPNPRADETRTITPISLKVRAKSPMFYWKTNYYFVLMPPDSVVNFLKSEVERNGLYKADDLLALIKADIPLSDDTDIDKYTLKNHKLWNSPEFIASKLLEDANASVISWAELDDKQNVLDIELLHLEAHGGKWRVFCGPDGEEIFEVNHVIL